MPNELQTVAIEKGQSVWKFEDTGFVQVEVTLEVGEITIEVRLESVDLIP